MNQVGFLLYGSLWHDYMIVSQYYVICWTYLYANLSLSNRRSRRKREKKKRKSSALTRDVKSAMSNPEDWCLQGDDAVVDVNLDEWKHQNGEPQTIETTLPFTSCLNVGNHCDILGRDKAKQIVLHQVGRNPLHPPFLSFGHWPFYVMLTWQLEKVRSCRCCVWHGNDAKLAWLLSSTAIGKLIPLSMPSTVSSRVRQDSFSSGDWKC